jgi:hypothetical protein
MSAFGVKQTLFMPPGMSANDPKWTRSGRPHAEQPGLNTGTCCMTWSRL